MPVADVAASFQEAVADVLTRKAVDACRAHGVDHLVIGGGVAANSRLRALAQRALRGGRDQAAGARGPACAPTTARWWRRSGPSWWPGARPPRRWTSPADSCAPGDHRPGGVDATGAAAQVDAATRWRILFGTGTH